MNYKDFIPFILSVEDKKNAVSIEYWFRVIDLKNDGVIDEEELEFFFKEQQQRIVKVTKEMIRFEDFLCQMNDIVQPLESSKFTLAQLKKSKLAYLFFDMLFDINKFIANEQKDSVALEEIHSNPHLTDWDRFALIEYEKYASVDDDTFCKCLLYAFFCDNCIIFKPKLKNFFFTLFKLTQKKSSYALRISFPLTKKTK
ncbi:hypothetical protein RFI_23794 [Reticulomyxa filosa]|uniref:EF-hand domain-containing protein n=1 Tax=Reticulomyxa filosa TaxID=46433 RepID=X6MHT1_RETFI|nr:hypothetical protein RFI_23794 [Reticulomyxa filosa]|eukprot:ETO13573.1 hypothetical protein RFI_23794 [Reticulomyxa filosa]